MKRPMTNANGIEEGPLPSSPTVDEDHLIYQRLQARISDPTKTEEDSSDD